MRIVTGEVTREQSTKTFCRGWGRTTPLRFVRCIFWVSKNLSLDFAGGTKTCKSFLDLCREDKNFTNFLKFMGDKN